MSRRKTVTEPDDLPIVPPPAPRHGIDFGKEPEANSSPGPTPDERVGLVAPPPGDHQFPIRDVLRNHATVELVCRQTGLYLSPGASMLVTIRDAAHLAQLIDVVAQFNGTRLKPGRLKFDRLNG